MTTLKTTERCLAATVSHAMRTSVADLVVLDGQTKTWRRTAWPEVYAKAEAIAERILDSSPARAPVPAVGLVGEPSADLVAAIAGAWLAGSAVSILPGPVRGASSAQWAHSTMERFAGIGVGVVLGHGDQLDLLWDAPSELPIHDLVDVARPGSGPALVLPHLDGARTAVLQGTAGSTGSPKTAALSANALLHNATALAERGKIDAGRDVGHSWLPLYHDMGLAFLMQGLVSGMPMWLAPNSAFAGAPFRWLEWLTESGATFTAAPNFAYDIIGRYGQRVKEADLGRIRIAVSGGEPIDCAGYQRFIEQTARFGFDPAATSPSYGLAESTCATTMPESGTGLRYDEITVGAGSEARKRRYAILGRAVAGMEVRIAAADGDVPTAAGREIGEVEIRGTSMMGGYLGHESLGAEEWFRTGDLGYLDDGELVICGRAKEVIIVAGRNIFPTEVERAAATVAGVRGGGVVAVGTDADSPRPGLVLAAEFRGTDETAARSAVIERVAAECGVLPADVVFVAPGYLPRTTSGKLRRLDVKRFLETGANS
ncbi:long-chain-fatty acid--ACP ligase MbtM [Aldersonia sp. NBC_00410]|uniref:long-chain-fatty acid--ACP ligase MbtM n=1 Tax=Aldersonia sp. NBC_00410 TaxID=2975954 RepID=UPI0022552E16|nr:long-chain-fatty acid--ACP ligase MbtM [Aldersonia sp. NBC_00410]MCX5042652.1 long-chain-fatty acid--ACP ligase MbtM [Aldersonia sp. NBC_00410]